MYTTLDRRQQKTRQAIFTAFASLLNEHSYSKITVQEIIDEANVGRSTFYAHFDTKDDLLDEMCIDLFNHVFSDVQTSEETHDFSMELAEPRPIVSHILYHLLDNKHNMLGLLKSDSGELFLHYFKQYVNEWLATKILDEMNQSALVAPKDFLINHISSSFIGMVQWWVKRGLIETPETLADYFFSTLGRLDSR